MKWSATQRRRGVTAIETAIGVSIAALIFIYAGNAIVAFVNTGRTVTEKTQALYLAEEGLELLRFVRDDDWSDINSIPLNTTRYLSVAPGSITITTTPENIDGFRRSFVLENVYRNASNDDIVAGGTVGATPDSETKYVTVSVSFGAPTTTVALTSILTNINP